MTTILKAHNTNYNDETGNCDVDRTNIDNYSIDNDVNNDINYKVVRVAYIDDTDNDDNIDIMAFMTTILIMKMYILIKIIIMKLIVTI